MKGGILLSNTLHPMSNRAETARAAALIDHVSLTEAQQKKHYAFSLFVICEPPIPTSPQLIGGMITFPHGYSPHKDNPGELNLLKWSETKYRIMPSVPTAESECFHLDPSPKNPSIIRGIRAVSPWGLSPNSDCTHALEQGYILGDVDLRIGFELRSCTHSEACSQEMVVFASRRKRTPEQWAYEQCSGPALLWITEPFRIECNDFPRFDLNETEVETIKMVLGGWFPIWMNTTRITNIALTHSYWRKEIHSRLPAKERERVELFLLCILRLESSLVFDMFFPIMWFYRLDEPALLKVRPKDKKRYEEKSWKDQKTPDRLELVVDP